MNSDELKGKWKQLQGAAKEKWGKLTDDELTEIEGDQDKLAGKIQEKYGVAREEAERQIKEWNAAA
ncbi:CsbD family protein [Hyphococcus luteus]|jgi:uncharacterized protein YjbJ (UPF0337 family)|uniref:CsbD family protein n=1 Tax=Hyphococcus luteus TaxID=2058213 RepID=A0A2S7K6B6_9PROT|nr:CsbD family protein [Marinicaulis flavus]PQA88032.1 CsbD family protein [Marinicaulis flavus]